MSELFISILTHPAFAIVTFLIGILFSNYFTLHRDNRNDFNTAAEILHKILLKERSAITLDVNIPTDIEFRTFGRHLSDSQWIDFDNEVIQYRRTKTDNIKSSQTDGNYGFHDKVPIIVAIDRLIKFTKRK